MNMSDKVEDLPNDEEISFVAKVIRDGGHKISLPEDVMKDLKLDKDEYVWVTLIGKKWYDMIKNDVGDIRKAKGK